MSANINTISPHHLIKTNSISSTTHIFICRSSGSPGPAVMTCCDGVRCRDPLSVCLGSPRLEFLRLWRFVMGFYSLTSLEILLFRNDTDILCCVEPQHNENSLMAHVTPQFMCKHYFPQQFCWSWPFQWILLELLNTQADRVGKLQVRTIVGQVLQVCLYVQLLMTGYLLLHYSG